MEAHPSPSPPSAVTLIALCLSSATRALAARGARPR